jgi:exodeoxyribonuclease-3
MNTVRRVHWSPLLHSFEKEKLLIFLVVSDLDMLCLQETKLQEMHVDDPKLKFRGMLEDAGYKDYWSCSTEKKGYSGTAVFVKERGQQKAKQASIGSFFAPKSEASAKEKTKSAELPVSPDTLTPTDVSYNIGKPIDNEGRTIVVEYPWATLTNVYVPNSGQDLKRLDYRTTEWDKDFLEFHKKKQGDRGLPVIWFGDLNIAHKPEDVWNDGAKHLEKQAGVTPQERTSFQEQLDSGFIDAFRKLHPDAKGHYSYWSQRAGNRDPNKGLRLDYFICSPDLFEQESKVVVRDSYILKECTGSDHCPVVLELEIKP